MGDINILISPIEVISMGNEYVSLRDRLTSSGLTERVLEISLMNKLLEAESIKPCYFNVKVGTWWQTIRGYIFSESADHYYRLVLNELRRACDFSELL